MSTRLRRVGVAGVVTFGAFAVAILGGGLAQAQETLPLTVTPASGPPGTQITVAGAGCVGEPDEVLTVSVILQNGQTHDQADTTPDAAGSWSVVLDVLNDPNLESQVLAVTALCGGRAAGTLAYAGSFSLEGAPPVTPPPTTPPTTPPATEPPSAGPPSGPSAGAVAPPAQAGLDVDLMPPATPVVAQPTHTG